MTRKTDTPPKRMRETRYRGPKLARPSSVQGFSPEQLDAHWKTRARFVLTVEDMQDVVRTGEMTIEFRPSAHVDYSARARRRLFDHFGLDPNDPLHWRQLIDYFAYIEFWEGPRKTPGRPRKDRTADDAAIAAEIATLPSQSNLKLAKQLRRKKDSPLSGKALRSARADIARVKKSLSKAGT
jgi:hypothetical protein